MAYSDPAPSDKRRRSPRSLASVALSGGLLVLAMSGWGLLIGSWTARYLPAPQAAADDRPAEQTELVVPAGTVDQQLMPELVQRDRYLQRADQTLNEGNYAAASRMYQWYLQTSEGEPDTKLLYRLGVCRELSGDLEPAAELYQQVASAAAAPWITTVAQLGWARIQLRVGNLLMAEQILGEILLNPQPLAQELRGDAAHLLAQVHARRAMSPTELTLLDDRGFAQAHTRWTATQLLQRYQLPVPGTGSGVGEQGVELLNRWLVDSRPENAQVRARLAGVPVIDIVRTLGDLCEVAVRFSDVARQSLVSRQSSLACDNLTASLLLDLLLAPQSLAWTQADDGSLYVAGQRELDTRQLSDYRRAVAERAIYYAELTYPEHPMVVLTKLAHGNLLFSEGRLDVASATYQEAAKTHAGSPFTAELWFNLGKSAWLQDNSGQARDAWFQVVDGHRSHALAGVASLYIGRMLLEQQEPEESVRRLKDAIILSRGEVKAAAVLCLAAAYLESDLPGPANQTMREYKDLLQGSSYVSPATLLSVLSQFLVASQPSERAMLGSSLVVALTHTNPEAFFGQFSYLMLGRAMQQLGLHEHRLQLYREALQHTLPPKIRYTILLELGRQYPPELLAPDIEVELQKLADRGQDAWSLEAGVVLAEFAFQRGEYDLCMERCLKLIPAAGEVERTELLKLMGRIYELRHDPRQAALCFAGILPEGIRGTAGQEQLR